MKFLAKLANTVSVAVITSSNVVQKAALVLNEEKIQINREEELIVSAKRIKEMNEAQAEIQEKIKELKEQQAILDKYSKMFANKIKEEEANIVDGMNSLGLKEVVSLDTEVKLRKNPPHLVGEMDLELVPTEYVRVKKELNKRVLLEDLKQGKEIEGFSVGQGWSVDIK